MILTQRTTNEAIQRLIYDAHMLCVTYEAYTAYMYDAYGCICDGIDIARNPSSKFCSSKRSTYNNEMENTRSKSLKYFIKS